MTNTATTRAPATASVEIRPFATLGHADHGWLDARHHFSFASYQDDARMNWGTIRVWNDDAISAQTGFPPHPHNDMEIITYVRTGAITHQDSLGNKGRTVAGDVQVMSAGTGIRHSEFNLEDETTTLFQIWIIPNQRGEAPGWGTRRFPAGDRSGQLVTLASGFAEDEDALRIRTDARVMAATIPAGETLTHEIGAGRHGYLVPSQGVITVNGQRAETRDGVALTGGMVTITAETDAEIVFVDAI